MKLQPKKVSTINDDKENKNNTTRTMTTVTVTTTVTTAPVQNSVTRPEDLHIKSCLSNNSTEVSPSVTEDQSSHPLLTFDEKIIQSETMSNRNSSIESETSKLGVNYQRKAYMDLQDAIALLDETCPNPNLSPSLTPRSPRTPRTPLTPHPRSKRARSKSSDNSSNYSNDHTSERSFENTKIHEKNKKRPFLRKIGISMTEERPFLAKFAPRIIGKPYLEKIGPSKAVEKPFLDKIGSSRTLDKFTFEWPRTENCSVKIIEENEQSEKPQQVEKKDFSKRSGKGFLSKMYSFETEDLDDSSIKRGHRDPLRGASLDDVIDKSLNCLPTVRSIECEKTGEPYSVELVKCKVTMSEEVLSSSTCLSSSIEGPMWENSPRRKRKTKKFLAEAIMRKDTSSSKEGLRSDESVPNSPNKRRLPTADNTQLSPAKSKRQNSEDILDKSCERHKDFDKCTVSTDNLFASKHLCSVSLKYDGDNDSTKPQSSAIRPVNYSISKESFKLLYNKFESQEVPTESYAEFKQRTQGNLYSSSALRRMADVQKLTPPLLNFQTSEDMKSVYNEQIIKCSTKPETKLPIRSRSVLRKQDGIDQTSDQECDNYTTNLNRQKKTIIHEPSQETVDLLTELRRVKSLLKTPSFEKDLDLEELKSVVRQPKKILITDKEFCLSVERENSIRRPKTPCNQDYKSENTSILSLAFFEKQCSSLDYVDDEKYQKLDNKTISLGYVNPRPSEPEEISDSTPVCDSKSYCSDVFSSPSEEQHSDEKKNGNHSFSLEQSTNFDVDISIPVDKKGCNPTIYLQNQSKINDQYEIMSPRVTPLKIKSKLGKICAEDTMKKDNSALCKANCGSVAVQKKTKCFPL